MQSMLLSKTHHIPIMGEKEKALDWLEKCYQDQDGACWSLRVDQLYDSLRNEPRFQALVAKIFASNR